MSWGAALLTPKDKADNKTIVETGASIKALVLTKRP